MLGRQTHFVMPSNAQRMLGGHSLLGAPVGRAVSVQCPTTAILAKELGASQQRLHASAIGGGALGVNERTLKAGGFSSTYHSAYDPILHGD
jgi:hypothetical protein